MKIKACLLFLFIGITSNLICQEFTKLIDIPYAVNPVSDKQKLDIYIPADRFNAMPCLVWIHGGAWLHGSKDGLPKEIDTLLHHGYVIASIGYRLSGESVFPAQIYDCKTAIRYLKANAANYHIDSTKIAVAGASAGGHLAALLCTSPDIPSLENKNSDYTNASSRVQAIIDYYGPTDFLIMDELPHTPPGICKDASLHLTPESPESQLLGCTIQDCPEKVKWANPITYITEDDPPFLIFHGTYDCTVTPKSSTLLETRLKEKSVPVELHLIPCAGHGGPQFVSTKSKSLVLEFLDTHLK